jgi:hypothetical protein
MNATEALNLFRSLEATAGTVSYDELETAFAPIRPFAVEVAKELGYRFRGSNKAVADQLYAVIERCKQAVVRCSPI